MAVQSRHVHVQKNDVERFRVAPRKRFGPGIHIAYVQAKNRIVQHLAHDLQRYRRVVDQQDLHGRRYAAMRCQDCLNIGLPERLGQKFIGLELPSEIDATPVCLARYQCDEGLVAGDPRGP